MSTINSQQSLRRTLKPRNGGGPGVPLAAVAAVVGVLLVGGGIGFAVETNHKHDSAPPVQTAIAAVDPAPNLLASVTAITHSPKSKKPGKHGATPAPLASPTATRAPSASPSTAPSLSPATGRKIASKHPVAHAKSTATTALTFDPAAASQATLPGPTVTNAPLQTAPPATAAPVAAPQATPAYEPAVVVEARFITQVQPIYPEIAKQQGIQGTTIVLATVGPTGNVISESIGQSAGNRTLDAAALDAARASTFRAPQIDGHPATETYRIVYTFSLQN